MDIGMLVVKEN